jgi:predicted nucleic acid-binding protein
VILVDASVWIAHFDAPNDTLLELLHIRDAKMHPFVLGEIALGHVRNRERILAELRELPRTVVVEDNEVLGFIAKNRLFGLGVGYVDAHLLTSTAITAGCSIWTFDQRLRRAAQKLSLSAD